MEDEEANLKFKSAKENISLQLENKANYFGDEGSYKRDSFAENFIPERIKTENSSILVLK